MDHCDGTGVLYSFTAQKLLGWLPEVQPSYSFYWKRHAAFGDLFMDFTEFDMIVPVWPNVIAQVKCIPTLLHPDFISFLKSLPLLHILRVNLGV